MVNHGWRNRQTRLTSGAEPTIITTFTLARGAIPKETAC
jgi:hypothetical protein